ncbi:MULTISPECIES: hypothetical protein [Roseobacteraceae]|uniref:Uncharacterized protein n=1 Tax=Pseudosulfitobacter pseudonitzschiae TaxID=1402135 RepID=A0A221K1G7_9RHOB|nr:MULTISPECIES: hypothetical protein [Roseobacteraceae]ASM72836.1 hypothetical protein SULPSESMR1_02033 [Pseudosulfitobacter pseudonitzschiae]
MCDWIAPETLPNWAAVIAAVAALIVARRGNSIASHAVKSQLKADIIRVNAASLARVQEIRRIILQEQSKAAGWRLSLKLEKELSDTLKNLTDFSNMLKDLDELSFADDPLAEAKTSSKMEVLTQEFEEAHRNQLLISTLQTAAMERIMHLSDFARNIATRANSDE